MKDINTQYTKIEDYNVMTRVGQLMEFVVKKDSLNIEFNSRTIGYESWFYIKFEDGNRAVKISRDTWEDKMNMTLNGLDKFNLRYFGHAELTNGPFKLTTEEFDTVGQQIQIHYNDKHICAVYMGVGGFDIDLFVGDRVISASDDEGIEILSESKNK